jgi:replicative DNA helicase
MSADGSPRHEDRIEQLRIPPQAIDAEQAVLGTLMLTPESIDDVADLIQVEDFYRRDHQLIYAAILDLKEKGKAYDALTVGEWFESNGKADQVEGGAYLIELWKAPPRPANVRDYAQIVADKSTLRRLITVGTEIVNDGFLPEGREADQIVAHSAAKMASLTMRGARAGGLCMLRGAMTEAWDEIVARDAGTIEVGLTPPWENVRAKLPGLEDTDFMVIAGRPGMGKTVTGLEFADHAASHHERNVAVFSLEMSKKQLGVRLLSRRARVDNARMRQKAALTPEDWSAINGAYKDSRALSIAIDDTASLTIDAIEARASRMHAKVPGGLGLIVIDYLQLISGDGRRDEKRYDEMTKISRRCKLMAKTLHCPVIGLSQLNRSLEGRTDKRPTMADLRESGAIEQDADIVAFVYRDDYYTKDLSGAPGVAEFIIGKQRNGPTGTAYLRHHLECSYFADYFGPRPNYKTKKPESAAGEDGFDDPAPSGRDRAAGRDR